MLKWLSSVNPLVAAGLGLTGLVLTGLGSVMPASIADARIAGQLTVEVDGLTNQDGLVCFSLFANSDGFPGNSQNAVQSRCTQISAMPMKVTFSDLAAGSYAIAVIHDENGDRTLNRNFLGIPTEGFGFSRNPVIRTGPPAFNDSAVLVAGADTSVQIQLNYLAR